MSKNDSSAAPCARHCSSRAFRVGDCVNLNLVEQPCVRLIAVVVYDDGDHYHCQYLNDDPDLDRFNCPPMKCRLEDATKIEDFGVVIRAENGEYWTERRGDSRATYTDGEPRKWQGRHDMRFAARPEIAKVVWPF